MIKQACKNVIRFLNIKYKNIFSSYSIFSIQTVMFDIYIA